MVDESLVLSPPRTESILEGVRGLVGALLGLDWVSFVLLLLVLLLELVSPELSSESLVVSFSELLLLGKLEELEKLWRLVSISLSFRLLDDEGILVVVRLVGVLGVAGGWCSCFTRVAVRFLALSSRCCAFVRMGSSLSYSLEDESLRVMGAWGWCSCFTRVAARFLALSSRCCAFVRMGSSLSSSLEDDSLSVMGTCGWCSCFTLVAARFLALSSHCCAFVRAGPSLPSSLEDELLGGMGAWVWCSCFTRTRLRGSY